ncbi:MAG: flavoprotein [Thermobacillus sp. ZCTH02-B1]|uniref:NAD(P)H-dependent oxidoreductase n=1 Tax=Thermobacillus sp. ZCTH02-B1 TaxID=1858795 RepID=UPI000B574E2D|nr:NAD(P)H-dependent oxidoreductase [Thermobacillus sp. ZCTH02-B1]OUM94407.1 MAG: flavoprotein [Thermobacillus sp. ZCTH02-B1]
MTPAHILVIYYSAYGHVFRMAQAAAEGASEAGCRVRVVRIPEMESEKNRRVYLDKRGRSGPFPSGLDERFKPEARFKMYETALEWQKDIPIATNDDLRRADGILWGFPTYYGMMPSQVKLFLEFAGELCSQGALEGKPAGFFTSAGSIHTGHEATLLTSMVPLFHFGMIMVGLPYTENPEYLTGEAIGCSPYGASTLAGPDSSLTPDPRELLMARRLGRRVANVAAALKASGFIRHPD